MSLDNLRTLSSADQRVRTLQKGNPEVQEGRMNEQLCWMCLPYGKRRLRNDTGFGTIMNICIWDSRGPHPMSITTYTSLQ